MKRFMNTQELADLLCTSNQVIRESRVSGKLFGHDSPAHVKLSAKKILYSTKEVKSYLNQLETRRVT